jgi:ferredoxin
MKARVDPVKCEGYGTCAKVAPKIYLLDEWGYAYTEGDGTVPEDQQEAAREGMHQCPAHAITIQES